MSKNKSGNLLLHTAFIPFNPAKRQAIVLLCLLCASSALSAQDEFVYDSKGRRDPFVALITPDGRLLKLEQTDKAAGVPAVEGIIYDKSGLSYAIINGDVKSVGDRASDYQVLKIEKDKVIFIKEGQPLEVKLKEGER